MKLEQRRRLTDLFAKGKLVDVLDENGEVALQVWVRKMTPADAEIAYLKASARRASILSMGKEEPLSDAYLALKGEIDLFSKENLVAWCVGAEMVERSPQVQTRISFDPEWAEENYLLSLQERLSTPDFQAKTAELPDDLEVKRVHSELERYGLQVTEALDLAEKEIAVEMNSKSDDELREKVVQAMLDSQADSAWLLEFSKCQVWRCVFDSDKKSQRMFTTREEVDEMQAEVLQQLVAGVDLVHVPDKEGKDSQQTPVS